jgi:hypothetical protein
VRGNHGASRNRSRVKAGVRDQFSVVSFRRWAPPPRRKPRVRARLPGVPTPSASPRIGLRPWGDFGPRESVSTRGVSGAKDLLFAQRQIPRTWVPQVSLLRPGSESSCHPNTHPENPHAVGVPKDRSSSLGDLGPRESVSTRRISGAKDLLFAQRQIPRTWVPQVSLLRPGSESSSHPFTLVS